MKWLRESDYHLTSEDRMHTICKFQIDGVTYYELWAGKEMVATRMPSADACKALVTQREAA